MSDIKGALTRKLGPLPAWAWAAVAGVALFLYRRHQGAQAAATDTTPTTSYYGPYGQGAYGITGAGQGGGTGGGDPGAGTGSGAPNITINAPGTVPTTTSPPAKTKPGAAPPKRTRNHDQARLPAGVHGKDKKPDVGHKLKPRSGASYHSPQTRMKKGKPLPKTKKR